MFINDLEYIFTDITTTTHNTQLGSCSQTWKGKEIVGIVNLQQQLCRVVLLTFMNATQNILSVTWHICSSYLIQSKFYQVFLHGDPESSFLLHIIKIFLILSFVRHYGPSAYIPKPTQLPAVYQRHSCPSMQYTAKSKMYRFGCTAHV